jgi:uncharacterized integral membrane protein
MRLRLILFVVLLAFCVVVITQNLETFSQAAPLKFFVFQSVPIKVYVLVLGAFLAGLLLASIWTLAETLGLRSQLRRKSRELEQLERELVAHRNLPLEEPKSEAPRAEKPPEP